jgi:nucleotide-binding universal stress UspA family protein
MASTLRTHLVLATIWEGAETSIAEVLPDVVADVAQSAQAHYTEYLAGIRTRLKDDRIRDVVRPGDAAEEILKLVDEIGARMLVIATHGRSGMSRWIYGSTAGRLLRESGVPVLTVGPNVLQSGKAEAAFKRIMVPLDGSELSEAAIPVARSLVEASGAKLSLVRVINWAVQAYPYSMPTSYIPQIDEELEKGAKAYLRKREEPLKSAGIDVDAFVVRGGTADGLLDFVEKQSVDLVVMTTRARTGIARAALGSTADRMLQGAAPVLLFPPEVAEAAASS